MTDRPLFWMTRRVLRSVFVQKQERALRSFNQRRFVSTPFHGYSQTVTSRTIGPAQHAAKP
jgi:hypothetical protein